ncbi:MAG: DUF917 family protein [Pseudonocardiaceae bacterium]|nr:DUF917 family protein [Pseudonocardiaceae bacterium]
MNGDARVPEIGPDDVDALVAGSEFFGASIAGSSVENFRTWTREVLERRGPVPLVEPGELDADTPCAAVGIAGSMTAIVELPPAGDEPATVLTALQNQLGRAVGAVMPMNAATINALFPVLAAAELGLPVVDCDGMGRILPLINQTSYALAGLPLTPLTATSAVRDLVSIDASAPRAELLIRAMLNTAGGWMLCALYPTEARNLVTAAIPGSMSRVVRVGRLLTGATDHDGIVLGLRETANATVLGSGRVVELGPSGKRGAPTQPANPTTVVVREERADSRLIRLEAQNELLLAVIDGVLATAVPDLLCLLDRNSLRMKGLERVGLGDEVDVLAVPAAPVWHSPAGLELAGPAAFGLPVRHPKERDG